MKKIAITFALFSLVGLALFAEGSQEETTWESGTGYMGRGYATQENRGRWSMAMSQGYNYPNQMPMGRGYTYTDQENWRPGPAGADFGFDIEELTLTGKIDLSDVNAPKLTVGENTYELMVPYRLDYDIDISDGDEITIVGFEVPAYRRAIDSESKNLMVTGATFNGEEYDLAPMNFGYMGGLGISGFAGKSGRFNNGGFQNNFYNQVPRFNRMMNTPYHRPYGCR